MEALAGSLVVWAGSPAPARTGLDWLVAGIALYAALVSTGAGCWAVYSWILTGGRAKVDVTTGLRHFAGSQFAEFPPRKGRVADDGVPTEYESQGFTMPLVLVRVRNKGRLEVTIEGVELRSPTGVAYKTIGGPEMGPRFPHTVGAGKSEVFGYEKAAVDAFAAAVRGTFRQRHVVIHAVVDLGTGKRVMSKTSLHFRGTDQPAE